MVDDELCVRHYAKRLLERGGFQVQTVSDGREGVEFFKQHIDEVKAAVVDMSLSEMNGLEIMHRLRECQPHIPVFIMSGYNESSVRDRPGGKDVTAYIQKPFKAVEFLTLIVSAINGGGQTIPHPA